MKNNDIIMSEKFECLKNEIDRLSAELSNLIEERDRLQYVVCKNIEVKYILLFGSMECELFEQSCEMFRNKLKIEYIQAKLNRQEKVDVQEIDNMLDIEFEKYKNLLNEQYERLQYAQAMEKNKTMTVAEMKKFKKMYHEVVKKIHPDLNVNLSEKEVSLFYDAVDAYKTGDYEKLEFIYETLKLNFKGVNIENSYEKLSKLKIKLEKNIEFAKNSINKIKSEFPYTEKDLIYDSEKISEKRKTIKEKTDFYRIQNENYLRKIAEMTR